MPERDIDSGCRWVMFKIFRCEPDCLHEESQDSFMPDVNGLRLRKRTRQKHSPYEKSRPKGRLPIGIAA